MKTFYYTSGDRRFTGLARLRNRKSTAFPLLNPTRLSGFMGTPLPLRSPSKLCRMDGLHGAPFTSLPANGLDHPIG